MALHSFNLEEVQWNKQGGTRTMHIQHRKGTHLALSISNSNLFPSTSATGAAIDGHRRHVLRT